MIDQRFASATSNMQISGANKSTMFSTFSPSENLLRLFRYFVWLARGLVSYIRLKSVSGQELRQARVLSIQSVQVLVDKFEIRVAMVLVNGVLNQNMLSAVDISPSDLDSCIKLDARQRGQLVIAVACNGTKQPERHLRMRTGM